MAFPWIFHSNFEAGSNAEWDSQTDTAARMDFPHFTELARFPKATPQSGAYCARVKLLGTTGDARLIEGDLNISAAATAYAKFGIWFSPDFISTATDICVVLELLAGSTIEVAVGFKVTATNGDNTDPIVMGIGEVAPTAFGSTTIERGVWYDIEVKAVLDAGTADDGTVDLFVTRDGDKTTTVDASQVGPLGQGGVTTGNFGIQGQLSTTTGTVLLDNFIFDDAQVFPERRYPTSPIFTKSQHAFVGPGWISSATLLTNESSNIMKLYDTDSANTNEFGQAVLEFDVGGTSNSFQGPLYFQRGCYVELSGTAPRGQVFLDDPNLDPGVASPRYYTDAMVHRHGLATRSP